MPEEKTDIKTRKMADSLDSPFVFKSSQLFIGLLVYVVGGLISGFSVYYISNNFQYLSDTWAYLQDPLLDEASFFRRNFYLGCIVSEDNTPCSRIDLEDITDAESFHTRYARRRWPVVVSVKSFSKLGWQVDKWSDDYLIKKIGNRPITVSDMRENSLMPDGRSFNTTLADFLTNTSSDRSRFITGVGSVAGANSIPAFPELINDILYPQFLMTTNFKEIKFALTIPPRLPVTEYTPKALLGLRQIMVADQLHVILKGVEEVVLFSPDDSFNLYPWKGLQFIAPNGFTSYSTYALNEAPVSGHPQYSTVIDPNSYDVNKFGRFKQARRLQCTLKSGDALYLPMGWWYSSTIIGYHQALDFVLGPAGLNMSGVRRGECRTMPHQNNGGA